MCARPSTPASRRHDTAAESASEDERHGLANAAHAAALAPAGQAAFEPVHVGVAQRAQALHRAVDQAFAIVIEDEARVAARDSAPGLELQLRQRQVRGPQRVRLRERIFLAHVDQPDLFTRDEGGADVIGGHRGGGVGSHGCMSKIGDGALGEYPETTGWWRPSAREPMRRAVPMSATVDMLADRGRGRQRRGHHRCRGWWHRRVRARGRSWVWRPGAVTPD